MAFRLVLLLAAVVLTSADTKVPQCDKKYIKKIQDYWSSAGQPPSGIVDSKDTFTVVSDTNTPAALRERCKHFGFSSSTSSKGEKTYTIIVKETNQKFPVSESNGILTVTDGPDKITTYVISYGNNLLVTYKCSENGPAVSPTVPPYVLIAATPSHTQKDVTKMEATLKKLGFTLQQFGCQ